MSISLVASTTARAPASARQSQLQPPSRRRSRNAVDVARPTGSDKTDRAQPAAARVSQLQTRAAAPVPSRPNRLGKGVHAAPRDKTHTHLRDFVSRQWPIVPGRAHSRRRIKRLRPRPATRCVRTSSARGSVGCRSRATVAERRVRQPISTTSNRARLPAELKHISKRRKRN